jgi:DNA-binding NarL/FixJ family response regulator
VKAVQQSTSQESLPSVVLMDPKVLRRAEMAAFLRDWGHANGVSIAAVAPGEMHTILNADARFTLGVLNLGADSLAVSSHLELLKELMNALPATPAAVVSDLESAEEVVTAIRAGARGFLPTSTEPEVALKALSFIMQGGSFFPPAALLGEGPAKIPRMIQIRPAHANGESSARLASLTSRQMAVLAHLQVGMSNKDIGALLGVTESTVKDDVRHIMRKLGAANRTQAALAADDELSIASLPVPRDPA